MENWSLGGADFPWSWKKRNLKGFNFPEFISHKHGKTAPSEVSIFHDRGKLSPWGGRFSTVMENWSLGGPIFHGRGKLGPWRARFSTVVENWSLGGAEFP